ncbi:MAG: diguanylate cyclase [Solirubrobacterales bacterium]|nr:diguanylate cyclase [Solirubrobacterales bacterium]
MSDVRDLGRAQSVQEACRLTVAHLALTDGLMPSIYVARGGRLRCQAAHGYRQVLDGMLPSTGVIGETYRTGEPHRIGDVAGEPAYLAAALDIVAEVCVPLRHAGIVVGALNVESRSPIAGADRDAIHDAAAQLEARLTALGGIPGESAAQRLARAVAHLASLTDADEIAAAILDAARDLTGMDSALLIAPRRGRPRAQAAAGRLADGLLGAAPDGFAALAGFTAAGSSFYSVSAGGEEFEGLGSLRAVGVRALAAVRVPHRKGRHGVLVAADSAQDTVATEQVELLELLAASAGSSLQTAAAIAELSRRAATDSLTGLGHHASFNERLATERAGRDRLAVLLIDVDGFKQINDTAGHLAGDRALRTVASRLAGALRKRDEVFRIGGDEFAAIVRVADEEEAVGIGHRLREAVAAAGHTVSVGVALPAEGESDASVLARADRALYAVKSSGRDGVSLLA